MLLPSGPVAAARAKAELELRRRERAQEAAMPPIWAPAPENHPQQAAYDSLADVIFYGGAAGGGKTDLILGLAVMAHRRSIIFRREFPQLKFIIERSHEILAPWKQRGWASYVASPAPMWSLKGGRLIEMGAVANPGDEEKYQGRPHDLKAFDEIPHFTEAQFRFLIGWNRTTHVGQRCRVVAVGNPPTGAEGDWIIRYWAPWLDEHHPNPAVPGELRWFTTLAGVDMEVEGPGTIEIEGELITPESRTFIPAHVEDNPYAMRTGYKAKLQALPEPLRSKLLKGDFRAGREDDPYQVIPSEWIRLAQERWKQRGRPVDEDGNLTPMSALGVDPARGGKDKTCICPRYDNWFGEIWAYPGEETPDGPKVATLVIQHHEGRAIINVDVIGIGSSVYDALRWQEMPVLPMNGSEGTEARDRSGQLAFVNQRAEWWWGLREALDPTTGDELAIPDDRELAADLTAPHWELRARGIQIESKEDIIKRIGRSPDRGESLVYAHAIKALRLVEQKQMF